MQCFGNSNGANMKLYKKFACENLLEINAQILNYINQLNWYQDQFWNPVPVVDLVQAAPAWQTWLVANHVPVKSVAVTLGVDVNCCGPHTDTPPSVYKLSWPVLNTEHTWNRWFQATDNAPVQVNALGGTSYTDSSSLTEIDRMRVDQPAIIATGIPHDVWFESTAVFPRWGLQCQLFNEPAQL
jgi:hypothetical protein